MRVALFNDSFPPLIDGVANAVVNYAAVSHIPSYAIKASTPPGLSVIAPVILSVLQRLLSWKLSSPALSIHTAPLPQRCWRAHCAKAQVYR